MKTFVEVVGALHSSVEQAAIMIESGGGAADLHKLHALLVDLTALLERDPGIDAAASDIFDAAKACAADGTADVRRKRLLREARLRLQHRLMAASPSEHARHMGFIGAGRFRSQQ